MNRSALENTNAYNTLKNDRRKGSVNHAYLLVTPDGRARDEFFEMAAELLLCENGGCGECAVCRQLKMGTHPDVKRYRGGVNVKTAEAIAEDTEIKPVESSRKLYFIYEGESMRADAQNKLLKTYEEPADYVTIFLAAKQEGYLLSTIKSRAKKLVIEPFDADFIVDELMLSGVERRRAESAAAFSLGSLERAEMFSLDENCLKLFDEMMNLLLELKGSKDIANYLNSSLADRKKAPLALDILELIFSDVLSVSSLKKGRIPGREKDINDIAKGYSIAACAVINGRINEARKKLTLNINAVTVAERLLFEILEAKYKWQQ